MKGKKSFVVYTDWQEIFMELSDDEAGRLIKHIFKYVNDENPVIEDRLLSILFKPIQLQLKRDLVSWNAIKEKRSEAGKIGGLMKSSKSKQMLANATNSKQMLAKPSKAKQSLANLAVNDNVNVNVNDINNNTIKYVKFIADANDDIDNFKAVLERSIKQKPTSIEQLLMKNKIDPLNELKAKIWIDFLKNATIHTPQIIDEKHAWNCFKLFVQKHANDYILNETKKLKDLE